MIFSTDLLNTSGDYQSQRFGTNFSRGGQPIYQVHKKVKHEKHPSLPEINL